MYAANFYAALQSTANFAVCFWHLRQKQQTSSVFVCECVFVAVGVAVSLDSVVVATVVVAAVIVVLLHVKT